MRFQIGDQVVCSGIAGVGEVMDRRPPGTLTQNTYVVVFQSGHACLLDEEMLEPQFGPWESLPPDKFEYRLVGGQLQRRRRH